MTEPTTDPVQDALAASAVALEFADLAPETVHAAKKRILDTVAAVFPALDAEPAVAGRRLAVSAYPSSAAAILGTRERTTLDMAAFVNATTARHAELNDALHIPGRPGGHPSDVITPLLAVAEGSGASGADLVSSVALAYEVYIAMAEATRLPIWDSTNWAALGVAIGAGKLLGFTEQQFRDCVAITVIPNNALRRSRRGQLSMWKAAAAGQAGRAGVFAALVVHSGMRGPSLPFVGRTGWLEGVASGAPMELAEFGQPRRLHRTLLKPRGTCGTAIPSVLAAERVFDATRDPASITRVLVETYADAKEKLGTHPHHWRPTTRESADHSIPYVVAAVLVDGEIGPEQFDDRHLTDPVIRQVVDRVEVAEHEGFTRDYAAAPHLHRTRVTVETSDGGRTIGETGGEHGEIGEEMDDESATRKFRSLTRGHLSSDQIDELLQALWTLDSAADVSALPALMVPRSDMAAQ